MTVGSGVGCGSTVSLRVGSGVGSRVGSRVGLWVGDWLGELVCVGADDDEVGEKEETFLVMLLSIKGKTPLKIKPVAFTALAP